MLFKWRKLGSPEYVIQEIYPSVDFSVSTPRGNKSCLSDAALALHEKEKHYLESIIKEGSNMFEQLEKCRAEKIEKTSLRAMYEEFKDTCHKSDVELLQVGTEHVSRKFLFLEAHNFDFHYLFDKKIYFFISCIYGGESLPVGNNTDKLLLLS